MGREGKKRRRPKDPPPAEKALDKMQKLLLLRSVFDLLKSIIDLVAKIIAR